MPEYDGTKMTKAFFDTGVRPDVTPKTESGRTLVENFDEDQHEAWRGMVLAIEQEAASKAVAEVLDAAEAVIEWLGPCDHFDHHGNCQTHGVEKPCRVETLRALIASERGT